MATKRAGTKKPPKKRVRRIQRDLPLYRQQAKDLELQLKRVKLQQSAGLQAGAHGPNVGVPSGSNLWSGIAERQWEERQRAEQHQKELKEVYGEMADVAEELQTLLLRCENWQQVSIKHTAHRAENEYWNLTTEAAENIFAEQLTMAAKLRLQLQPAPTLLPHAELTTGREMVKWDPKIDAGFKWESHSGVLLPFTLDVVAQAYWRFFGFGYADNSRVRNPSDLKSDVSARSVSLRAEFEDFNADITSKVTCRKYVDEEGITIAWVGIGDVLEIDGEKFDGVQVHKRGTIKLRRVAHQGPGNASYSTIVEMTFEMIPVFRDGLIGRATQAHALVSANDKTYSKVNETFCQALVKALVEEDWKATFGQES